MCQIKQMVKQQEEPQPKPQVEQEKTPQEQVKINYKHSGWKSKTSNSYSRCQDVEQESNQENEEE
jgi:hypothetical protein